MNASLIAAANQALYSLKHLHTINGDCDGLRTCPHAAAIRELEVELAKVRIEGDPEFQAVDTTGMLAAADPSDIAHSAIRAAQQIGARWMPATRLCVDCDSILPSTTPATMNRCTRCAQ